MLWGVFVSITNNVYRATPALTSKWGYESLDEFKQNSMQDYSLVLDGTLEQNSTQLLMINVSFSPPWR